jgi:methylglutaconyl-CoA hydratase
MVTRNSTRRQRGYNPVETRPAPGWKHLIVETTGLVCRLTLNRPEIHNAFNETLIAELTDAIGALSRDESVRVIVLEGAGKSFCAGADLDWMRRMASYSHEENLEDARALQRMFASIAHCPKPTIAAVHGAAIGGGAGLVAVCDIAIATDSAVFALSEVRLGLVPAVVGPYVLEKVGMGAARALFVSGERFGAAEALRIGLVQHVVSNARGELDAAVDAKVELLAGAGPNAIAAAKQLLRDISHLSPDEAAEITAQCIATLRASDEGREGIQAFLDKRPPAFGHTRPAQP